MMESLQHEGCCRHGSVPCFSCSSFLLLLLLLLLVVVVVVVTVLVTIVLLILPALVLFCFFCFFCLFVCLFVCVFVGGFDGKCALKVDKGPIVHLKPFHLNVPSMTEMRCCMFGEMKLTLNRRCLLLKCVASCRVLER